MKKIAMKQDLIALSAAFVLAGCNTVKGVGQDVQRAGGAIERAAK
jgi:predicted small secreted protein